MARSKLAASFGAGFIVAALIVGQPPFWHNTAYAQAEPFSARDYQEILARPVASTSCSSA